MAFESDCKELIVAGVQGEENHMEDKELIKGFKSLFG